MAHPFYHPQLLLLSYCPYFFNPAPAGEQAEVARDLAYRLYAVCERKGWAQEALAYNNLVMSWSEVGRLVRRESGDLVQGTFLR